MRKCGQYQLLDSKRVEQEWDWNMVNQHLGGKGKKCGVEDFIWDTGNQELI
jgi:hypothetical protein